ncbi:MAG: ATP-binding protein [Proteobacteria bacterium]|nr:ATP-binding protein [Pseudomonadota bacterium]
MAELDHRVKNTLAIVQSIASQTARGQTDIDSYVTSLLGRLQALGVAQSILSDGRWTRAELGDLIRAALAMTVESGDQITFSGESVFVPPQTAVQLTLVLHELATNAVRHGALSVPSGTLKVSWSLAQGAEPAVVIDWVESGGPAPKHGEKKGFGLLLIERSGRLPHLKTEVEFGREGVHCRIRASLPDESGSQPQQFFATRTMDEAASEHQAENSARRKPRSPRLRVLLVEDDPIEALRIEEQLADFGCLVIGPVQTIDSSAAGLDRGRYDVAIVDLDARTLDGAQLVAQLRSLSVPCIGVSHERGRADLLGPGDALVLKPVSGDALRDALGTLGGDC